MWRENPTQVDEIRCYGDENPSGKGLASDLPPPMQIEPFFPKQCALSVENLQTYALPSQIPPEMNLKIE
jgi:hypothetical protein